MNVIGFNLLTVGLASLVGLAEYRRLSRKEHKPDMAHLHHELPYLLPLGLLVLSAAGGLTLMNSRPEWSWVLPWWVECHSEAIIWGSVVGFMSFSTTLVGITTYATGHPRRFLVTALGTVFVGFFVAAQIKLEEECIAERLKTKISPDGAILQSSAESCVAASAANVVALSGGVATEREMAQLMGTTQDGTSAGQLVRGMRSLGIPSRKVFSRERCLSALQSPAILFLAQGKGGPVSHAVVFLGFESNKVSLIDPLRGRVREAVPQLEDSWSGLAVECDVGRSQ